MKFRPCIDIHNGSVKQIVGGTLSDRGNQAECLNTMLPFTPICIVKMD